MKVLVTGGAGFIGSHLVDSMLRDSYKIITVDNFDPFYNRNIKEQNIDGHYMHSNYGLIEGDIRNRELVLEIFKEFKPDVVVHLAGKAGVRPSLEDPLEYVDVNINGTVNLLDASVKYNVKKFIFASSSSVYGLNKVVPFSENHAILNQASPYGATKASGEALCRSYSNCFNLPIVALRFFTVYGPRQRPDLAIHKFTENIINSEPITLFGDGLTCRDYTYIDDIVFGIKSAINLDIKGYEAFNLGNDHPIQLINLVNKLEEILNKSANINWMPEQVGDVPQTWASISKAKKILNYQPIVNIDNGLSQFVDWIKNKN